MSHGEFGVEDSSYHAAGGEEGIRKLTEDFYRVMDSLPEARDIRNMHPKDLTVSIDKLALFLCGWLGGPRKYQEKYGPIRIPQRHAHLRISYPEKTAWLKCMELALQEQDYSSEFRTYLMKQFEIPAERIRLVCNQSED